MNTVFNNTYASQGWGKAGDGSGDGSEIEVTQCLRRLLTEQVKNFQTDKLVVFLDAACGACKWQEVWLEDLRSLGIRIEYIGVDCAAEPVYTAQRRLERFKEFHRVSVFQIELSNVSAVIPKGKVDILLCRDCLMHLSYSDAADVLQGLAGLSANRYLLTCSTGPNEAIETGGYYRVCLWEEPFGMTSSSTVREDPGSYDNERSVLLFDGNEGLLEGVRNLRRIPKIIHQMWWSDPEDPREPHEAYVPLQMSFRSLNPTYEIKFWKNKDILDFWDKTPSIRKVKPLLDKMLHIEKCDVTRYAILFVYGGIYVDMNVECIKPLDSLLAEKNLFLALEPEEHKGILFSENILTNSIMASSPGNMFWLHLLERVQSFYTYIDRKLFDQQLLMSYTVATNTGTSFLYKHALHLLGEERLKRATKGSTCAVMPLVNTKTLAKGCRCEDAYCCKLWWGTSGWGTHNDIPRIKTFKECIRPAECMAPLSDLTSVPRASKKKFLSFYIFLGVLLLLFFVVLLTYICRQSIW
jgi:Glycosyltransferase sugar-binding region containing DXD motif/Methyltransferase domain